MIKRIIASVCLLFFIACFCYLYTVFYSRVAYVISISLIRSYLSSRDTAFSGINRSSLK